MNLITLGEEHPVYQRLAAENGARHYEFVHSMVESALSSSQAWLSESLIKAINFHAIAGLHPEAGQYRVRPVYVAAQGNVASAVFSPPSEYEVVPLMENLVNEINWNGQTLGGLELAARAMWGINYIHPFVNGNGRTARAVCYFVLCVKSGGWLPGGPILPERLREPANRQEYEAALRDADNGNPNPLVSLIQRLLTEQLG